MRSDFKFQLYCCTSYYELNEKYDMNERVKANEKQSMERLPGDNKIERTSKARCYNCGSKEHLRRECNNITKFFKCNEFGHILKNCQGGYKVNLIQERKRCKLAKLNNIEVECLTDSGSDVSIIQKKIFGTIENVKLRRSGSLLRGLGNKKTVPVGEFLGTVCVDDDAAEQKLIVVLDGAIEYDVILGFDFMARFCVVLNEDGYVFMKRKVVQSDEVLKELSVYSVVESEADIRVHTPMQFKPLVKSLIADYQPAKVQVQPVVELKIVPDGQIKPFRQQPTSTAKIAMKANAAKAILDEPTAATEAYRKSVAQGIYCIHGARLWRMKHQAVVPLAA
ncbi:hypothetical protein ACLKA6_017335 [Drosophila palustris]